MYYLLDKFRLKIPISTSDNNSYRRKNQKYDRCYKLSFPVKATLCFALYLFQILIDFHIFEAIIAGGLKWRKRLR